MSAHDDYLDPDRFGLFDDAEDNSIVEQAFADFDGPYDVYRSTYKGTSCGPSVGFRFRYLVPREPDGFNEFPFDEERVETVYCDDLDKWGTWKDLAEQGVLVVAVGVSSIVEGVDYEVPWREIGTTEEALEKHWQDGEDLSETLRRLYWQMVEEVNQEAEQIWQDTHGCDICQEHWAEEGLPDGENEYGYVTVWADCPNCGGHGTII